MRNSEWPSSPGAQLTTRRIVVSIEFGQPCWDFIDQLHFKTIVLGEHPCFEASQVPLAVKVCVYPPNGEMKRGRRWG
jgi:hypothetical protein